jgi:hypothetical protein
VIAFKMEREDSVVIGISLLPDDLAHLLAGEELEVRLWQMGFPGVKAVIFLGASTEDVQEQLREAFGEITVVLPAPHDGN